MTEVLAKLTLRLVAMPEEAWGRFTVAHRGAEELPSPLLHVLAVSAVSVVATLLGWPLKSGWTSSGLVLQALVASVGYGGGALLAVLLTPRLLASSGLDEADLTRFASGAVLPVALSGVVNIIPLIPMTLLFSIAAAASSAWSGWIGASTMLALEGDRRKQVAMVPAALAAGLVLLTTLTRWTLPK